MERFLKLKSWFLFIFWFALFFYLTIAIARPLQISPVPGSIQNFEWFQRVFQILSWNWVYFWFVCGLLLIPSRIIGVVSLSHFNGFCSFSAPFWVYPPRWLGISIGVLVALLANPYGLAIEARSLIFLILLTILFKGIFQNYLTKFQERKTFSRKKGKSKKNIRKRLLSVDDTTESEERRALLKDLRDWASKEIPTNESESDFLDSTKTAKQLLELLLKERITEDKHDRGSTLGLIGPYGSGKTSIFNFVKEELKNDSSLIVVSFSCWGIGDARKVEYQLVQVLSFELTKRVDVMQLHSLPEKWLELMGGDLPWFARLALSWDLVGVDATELFRRLNHVLKNCNLRLVIFLEDADREAGPGYYPNQLHPLLEQLGGQSRISTIIAAKRGSLSSSLDRENLSFSLDLDRICNRLVDVPRVDTALMRAIFMTLLYELGPKDLEWDPKLARNFTPLWGADPFSSADTYIEMLTTSELVELIGTPRRLKKFCNRVIEGWERLKGEVNFYDFVLLTLIRVALPSLFDYLLAMGETLLQIAKMTEDQLLKNEQNSRIQSCKQQWSDLLKEQLSPAEGSIASKLVSILFGPIVVRALGIQSPKMNRATFYGEGLQRIQQSGGTLCYWNRIIREDLSPLEVSDQDVKLRYKQAANDPKVLANELIKSDFAEKFLHLNSCFKPLEGSVQNLFKWLDQYLFLVVTNRLDLKEPLITAIVSWFGEQLGDKPFTKEQVIKEVTRIIKKVSEIDLYVALKLAFGWSQFFFKSNGLKIVSEEFREISQVLSKPIKKVITDFVKEKKWEQLWEAIPEAPGVLKGLIDLRPDEDQSWLRPFLEFGLQYKQERMKCIPQLILCVGSFNSFMDYKYDENKAKSLLGPNFNSFLDHLKDLLSRGEALVGFDLESNEKIHKHFAFLLKSKGE